MPDAREIYHSHPEDYDALVRSEDHQGNLLEALRGVVALAGADVIELGAGTGRITALLAPHVQSIRAFDGAAPMLEVARRNLARLGLVNWQLELADNARLPVPDGAADLAIAGWTYGHETVWNEARWREPIRSALDEMLRVLRPGGTAIVIETLGTGFTAPFTPPPELGRYYELLTHEYHFDRTWIRTDYAFPSMAEGERLLGFFFGQELAQHFTSSGSPELPECTGLWWRRKERA